MAAMVIRQQNALTVSSQMTCRLQQAGHRMGEVGRWPAWHFRQAGRCQQQPGRSLPRLGPNLEGLCTLRYISIGNSTVAGQKPRAPISPTKSPAARWQGSVVWAACWNAKRAETPASLGLGVDRTPKK